VKGSETTFAAGRYGVALQAEIGFLAPMPHHHTEAAEFVDRWKTRRKTGENLTNLLEFLDSTLVDTSALVDQI
jgi:hypothetical protein